MVSKLCIFQINRTNNNNYRRNIGDSVSPLLQISIRMLNVIALHAVWCAALHAPLVIIVFMWGRH